VLVLDGAKLGEIHTWEGSTKETALGEELQELPGTAPRLLIAGPGADGKGGERLIIDLAGLPTATGALKKALKSVAAEPWDGKPGTLLPTPDIDEPASSG
jgi:hypothetical protein